MAVNHLGKNKIFNILQPKVHTILKDEFLLLITSKNVAHFS